jgi:nitroreductase
MCRSFLDVPVSAEKVDRLLHRARQAPSAGNAQGWAFVVLEGPEQTGTFWEHAAAPRWQADPSLPGLLRAPVVILALSGREIYVERYREPDKSPTGDQTRAKDRVASWDTPYWTVDTAFAVMLLLLGATAEGLGALFFRLHGDRQALLDALRVPPGWDPIGAVALGWPDPDDQPATSAARGRRPWADVVHRGRW